MKNLTWLKISRLLGYQTYDFDNNNLQRIINFYLLYNRIKLPDFIAGLLEIIQHDVQTEPPLQPTTTESTSASGYTADGARLNIRAKGFWRDAQDAYFAVRVTNPLAATAMKSPLASLSGHFHTLSLHNNGVCST